MKKMLGIGLLGMAAGVAMVKIGDKIKSKTAENTMDDAIKILELVQEMRDNNEKENENENEVIEIIEE